MTQTKVFTLDGQLMEMKIEGDGEVVKGPLSQFIDLAATITADANQGDVPPEILAVLDELACRKEQT
jgi:hypothetical protein